MISFGGGVNSVAMTILLFKRGQIMPVVFVDTMAEHPDTYCYMDYFEKEFMGKYGVKITRLSPKSTPHYYYPYAAGKSLEEYSIEKQIIPFGAGGRYCSKGWKLEPLMKYRAAHNEDKEVIGFAWDERHRAKDDTLQIYPLIEAVISREGCFELIEAEGMSRPPKSSCFFCPYQRIGQWEELYRKYPELWERAENLEKNASHERQKTLRADRIPLRYLRDRFDGKGGDLFPDFDFEELTPCACML